MRALLAVAFLLLALRLVALQGFSSQHYAAIGSAEVTNTTKLTAVRGGMYDRNGQVLALSVPTSDLVADPYLIRNPAGEAAALAPLLGLPEAALQLQLSANSGYQVLARQLDSAVVKTVTALNLPGLTTQADAQRIDPGGTLASPVLGAVGGAGIGQSGLEYQDESLLSGRTGSATQALSPSGVPLPDATGRVSGAQPGTGLELTLDQPLQYVTEQSLAAEIQTAHAKSGIAVIMNTHTGDILSMANLVVDPTTGAVVEAPSNLALTQVYEPGSVFKLVTFSAALQAGIITPQQVFSVPYSIVIDGAPFHDAESHPTLNLSATNILAQSSNIGTIEIAQGLGADRLAAQITNLGFGQPTGLHFPGESEGIVVKTSKWQPTDTPDTAIGQDDAVTAQQVLDMVNTVATGGSFVPPRLVRATVNPDGTVTAAKPAPTHRALSSQVTSELTAMMESVVKQDGTAVLAGIPGYTVAGKTGTAQIPFPTHLGYIPGAYMATFAGFAPAENPQLSAIVVLDQPTPIFGGQVAAPVFSQIMRYALHRYGVPTSPGVGKQGGVTNLVPYPPASAATDPSSPVVVGPTTTTTAGTIHPKAGTSTGTP